mmetsp:Transcript_33360/g.95560  ORF Transcript_33360/g.95560 Transcript_33360/m.95560 type:complete len:273 (+) Transcript_33360:1959-2777(+)
MGQSGCGRCTDKQPSARLHQGRRRVPVRGAAKGSQGQRYHEGVALGRLLQRPNQLLARDPLPRLHQLPLDGGGDAVPPGPRRLCGRAPGVRIHAVGNPARHPVPAPCPLGRACLRDPLPVWAHQPAPAGPHLPEVLAPTHARALCSGGPACPVAVGPAARGGGHRRLAHRLQHHRADRDASLQLHRRLCGDHAVGRPPSLRVHGHIYCHDACCWPLLLLHHHSHWQVPPICYDAEPVRERAGQARAASHVDPKKLAHHVFAAATHAPRGRHC